MLVAGEAGVGKSRLLSEAARRAQGFNVLQAHGYDTDLSFPFAPFVDGFQSSQSVLLHDAIAQSGNDHASRQTGQGQSRGLPSPHRSTLASQHSKIQEGNSVW